MTFYITPSGRMVWRRGPARDFKGEYEHETGSEVFVPVNVKAEDETYVITALVPGLKPDDISIQVHNETLTLKGELANLEGDSKEYLVREMPVGRFYRVIHLPEQLDSAKAEAELNDGVLTLRVPKAEVARPKTIKVNSN